MYFFIWDGNHRLQAWTEFISESYSDNYDWHYHVRSTVLRMKDDVASILMAMHDINKASENSHVKTNLVHTLHQMQKVGVQDGKSLKSTRKDLGVEGKRSKEYNRHKGQQTSSIELWKGALKARGSS